MAGDWIKVENVTPDKPEILKVARITGLDKDSVLGKLVRLWKWFDSNSVDGVVDGVVSTDVDAIVDHSGFAVALSSVGWLFYDDDAEKVTLPNFGRHNGETAKKRALKNKRQERWRQNVDISVDAPPSTSASTREEKRREDNTKSENKFSDEDLRFAKTMHVRVSEVFPHVKEPNIEKWANTVRLLRERDGISLREAWEVFDWANRDTFWQSNIMCPQKLREQYPKLAVQMKNDKGTHVSAIEDMRRRAI